jgi:hypothetical protein
MISSNSEQGQDLFAYESVPGGQTFLDVGCGNPIYNNNTFILEHLGWRGVLIDIDHRWAEPSKVFRTSPFIEADVLKVDWRDITQTNNLGPEIDYLSLDVDDHPDFESYSKTFRALENIVNAGLRFRAITVEHDAYRTGAEPRSSIRKFLRDHGYKLFRADVSCRPPDPNWSFEDWFVRPQ